MVDGFFSLPFSMLILAIQTLPTLGGERIPRVIHPPLVASPVSPPSYEPLLIYSCEGHSSW